jgi:hypothetical protein
MFKIIDQAPDTIEWPVSVGVPADGGKIRKFEFTGMFKRRNQDDRDDAAKQAEDSDPAEWVENFVDRIKDIMVGWSGVSDADGNALPFSIPNLRKACRSVTGPALIVGINKAVSEYEFGTKVKN